MKPLYYLNRKTSAVEKEEIFGEKTLHFLYGTHLFAKPFRYLVSKWPFASKLYGWCQSTSFSRRNIAPFVKRFDIDVTEFEKPVEAFTSFNDFFIRKLIPSARQIAGDSKTCIAPADARYRFFPKISKMDTFSVKERTFCIETILQDKALADKYHDGSLLLARLCPTDCHRFYFPFDCVPGKTKQIKGSLFSVSPFATGDNPWIWGENRRMLTLLDSKEFGEIAYMEVGATNVGSITQTFIPGEHYKKGDEKGFFSFGGSALLLFFEKNTIEFSSDLIGHDIEVRLLIGEEIGRKQEYS